LQKLLALVDLLVVGNRCLWQHGVQQEPFARACHPSSPLSLRLPEVCVDNKALLPISAPVPPHPSPRLNRHSADSHFSAAIGEPEYNPHGFASATDRRPLYLAFWALLIIWLRAYNRTQSPTPAVFVV